MPADTVFADINGTIVVVITVIVNAPGGRIAHIAGAGAAVVAHNRNVYASGIGANVFRTFIKVGTKRGVNAS